VISSASEIRLGFTLFVSCIMQKRLDQFSENSEERWHILIWHGPRTKWVDFRGNPNLDQDPGII